MKTLFLTSLALMAFAGNSVLCRLALGPELIDASSFTAIRLLSGVIVLWLLVSLQRGVRADKQVKPSWWPAVLLFAYAACFSFAYINLQTGTGALVLFAAVQFTIISYSLWRGQRLVLMEWLGLIVACTGFVMLMLPSATSPSPMGLFLMTIAGMAWGGYTLLGRQSKAPLMDTYGNFLRSVPFAALLLICFLSSTQLQISGIVLAVLSGGLASGVGYAIWYQALTGLTAVQAAVVQLLVPVIATLGGVIFAQEHVSAKFLLCSGLILGGIFVVIAAKTKLPSSSKT